VVVISRKFAKSVEHRPPRGVDGGDRSGRSLYPQLAVNVAGRCLLWIERIF